MSPNVEKALHETVSFHEALRRLGYAADDIFVQCSPDGHRDGKPSAFTLLRVRGMTEVNFTSGHFDTEQEAEEFYKAWGPFVERWNSDVASGDTWRAQIYNSSFVANQPIGLISTLMRKGHTVELLQQDSLRRWFNA